MHMTSGNTKPYSTETSTLLVLLVRISKPLVQHWLRFVNSEHPSNSLCLCYFRMMWLRPYFKQLLLRKELFTDHETTPKIIQLPQDSRRGNKWNKGHHVLGYDLKGWWSQAIQLLTSIFALVSELEMQ